MDILFFVAIAIILGFIASKLAHRIKLPGVVGYLIAGLILGPSFLNIFDSDLLGKLSVFTSLTLSLVAFTIGSEMKLGTFKEMGKGIAVITLLESFGAFLIVAAGVYFLTGKLYLALIFGAMAPASAPAGTVAVLQECKAKGRLTNALYAVVGLDDGLAIMIFAFAVAVAKILLTGGVISPMALLQGPILEIIGSIILGIIVGTLTGYFCRKVVGQEGILAVSLGGILICSGIANYLHFSLILANLSLGMTFANLFSAPNRKAYRAIQSISLPIYIIFFFLAGARLHIKLLPSMGLLGLVYVVCRITGLIGGAFIGATLSKQSPVIRKYLGLGILSQAGVAIGLAVLAAAEFSSLGPEGKELSIAVVNIIAATSIFFEIIGPIGTKFAISKAAEIGVNITEEDLIETYTVSDVMETKIPLITAGMSLNEVIKIVSGTSSFYYSVVDKNKKLIGAITLDGIRNTFTTQELNDWLVALDVAEPIVTKLTPDIPLSEALKKTKRLDVEYLPVVDSSEENKFVGILDCRAAKRALSAEVLARQQKAESMHATQQA
ncbi:MAG: cation:proton antiporter [Planctomycetes bacterium]|nr:cation:proton antiporter [Planctomycetota bacterium]